MAAELLYPPGADPGAILRGRTHAPILWHDIELGISICWEIHFSSVIAASVRDGADVLVNLANESWIRSDIAQQRSLVVARMRAVESGRMLLRVANRGVSAVIDANGDVIEMFAGTGPLATTVEALTDQAASPNVGSGFVIRF